MNKDFTSCCQAAIRSLPDAEPPYDITSKVMEELLCRPPSRWQRLRQLFRTPIQFQTTPLASLVSIACCTLFFMAGYWSHSGLNRATAPTPPSALSSINNAEANFVIGRGFLLAGMDDQALSFFKKAAQLAPERPEYHFWQGISYGVTGNYEQERTSYQTSIKLNPEYLPSILNLANSYLQGGGIPQAQQLYQQVLLINPQEKQARYNLALAYRASGDKPEEITALEAYLANYKQGKRAFAALRRLQDLGNSRYRAYQFGMGKLILDQRLLLTGSGQAWQEEMDRIAETLHSAPPMQLHIVVFDPAGMNAGRSRAIELNKYLTRSISPKNGHRVTSSWFHQVEPLPDGSHHLEPTKSILLFGTSNTTFAQEQQI